MTTPNEDNTKIHKRSTAAASMLFSDKAFIAAAAAAVVSGIASCFDKAVLPVFYSCLISAVFLIAAAGAWCIPLSKRGVDGKLYKEAIKRINPSLLAGITDYNGIGSILGAAASIALLFGDVFIADGGIMSSDNFAAPLAGALAQTVCTASALCSLTAGRNIRSGILLSASEKLENNLSYEDYKRSLLRRCEKYCTSPDCMRELSSEIALRLTAIISICPIALLGGILGFGSPYCCFMPALLYLAVTLLSFYGMRRSCTRKGNGEKLPLLTCTAKRIIALNAVIYIALSVFFLLSYPVRSVYTEYTISTEFYYTDEYVGDIGFISIPNYGSESSSMFMALSVATALCLCIACIALSSDSIDFFSDTDGKNQSNVIVIFLTGAAVCLAAVLTAAVYPEYAIDAVGWLTAFTFAAFMLLVNIIHGIILHRANVN